MNPIQISDVTMKQPAQAQNLSFREKIELSKLLDKLCVSAIELDGITNSSVDSLRIKSIASAVCDSIVAVPVQLNINSVNDTWKALCGAKHPRLQVVASTSSVQMEYLFHKKPDAMIAAIEETVKECRTLCADVEFIADDATRADSAFLYKALSTAIAAGATTVTVCDTAGVMLPEEFAAFIRDIKENVPAVAHVTLAVSCPNNLAMADACAIAAVCQGADEIKASIYPADTAKLANIARIISVKGEAMGVTCPIQVTQLSRATEQAVRMCQSGRSKTSPFDSGVREDDGTYLTVHDNMEAVLKAAAILGYDLSEEDGAKVYDAFCSIIAKKNKISTKELDAIVASAAMQVPPTYILDTFIINSGNTIAATAHIKLKKGDKVLEGVCVGDGPIDAAFLAIESITGCHYELDDFQIQAVTEGREAMGQTVVKLLSGGKVYSGRGISTDIVGASIRAYLSALNKIVYEEAEG